MCSNSVWAHDFEVDGIYYKIISATDKTVLVTYRGTSSTQYSNEYSGEIIIPNEVIYNDAIYNVTEIGSNAFRECSQITSVTIPNNVTKIGTCAFLNCTGLKNLIIKDGVSKIHLGDCSRYVGGSLYDDGYLVEQSQFATCSLEYIYIGRNFEWSKIYPDFGGYIIYSTLAPFRRQKSLQVIIIGKNVTTIDQDAFDNSDTNYYFYSNPTIGADAIPSTANCHLMLDDSYRVDFNTANENTYSDVSYTRTINEGKYGTIMLPFTPDAASLENYAFYELAESGDGYMKFEEVVAPVANTPYIYTLREGKENIAITGGETTISSNIVTPEVDGWQTIGSFNNQTIDTSGGNYYALSATDNEINRITKSLTVLPYRAYFKSADASKSALNIYISGTTGIEKISLSEIEGFENGGIFDLSGRKVTEPINGNIYIKNGKKIMF